MREKNERTMRTQAFRFIQHSILLIVFRYFGFEVYYLFIAFGMGFLLLSVVQCTSVCPSIDMTLHKYQYNILSILICNMPVIYHLFQIENFVSDINNCVFFIISSGEKTSLTFDGSDCRFSSNFKLKQHTI